MNSAEVKQNLKNEITRCLLSIPGVLSTTLVGSFVNQKGLNGISDIDTVVICEKLHEGLFTKCIEAVSKIDLVECGLDDYKLFINSTFGPLKYDGERIVVVHLMIYDVESHKNHVIKSPFTCYDWERSDVCLGQYSLKEVFPTGVLSPRDFFGARRGLSNYLEDLNDGIVSYREYGFSGSDVIENKHTKELDDRHKGEYAFHIVKNLILNYQKLHTQRNDTLSNAAIVASCASLDFFDKEDEKKLLHLTKLKEERSQQFPGWTIDYAKSVVDRFSYSLKSEWDSVPSITFMRHAKTPLNDGRFLGRKVDPDISLDTDTGLSIPESYNIFSSPLRRCISTLRYFNVDEDSITQDNRLLEIDYGNADGFTYDELSHKFPEIPKMWESKVDAHFPGGENHSDVLERVNEFILDKIIDANNSAYIMTHNVVLRVLLGYYYKLPQHLWYLIHIPHTLPLEFKLFNGRLYPNIEREQLGMIFGDLICQSWD